MGGLECTVDAWNALWMHVGLVPTAVQDPRSKDAECIDKSGKAIPGLYVAGEAAGGIHGNNRLGGNSLLDCVAWTFTAGWPW